MKIKTILGVALAAGTLVSCSVEDDNTTQTPASETYARDFIKTFGAINAKQNWNMVEQKSINIDVDVPTQVKVYELQGGEYRLAANYSNVTKQTITFDGVKGDDTNFMVSIGGKMYAAENGQTFSIKNDASSALRATKIPDEHEQSGFIRRGSKTVIQLASSDNIMNNLAKNGVDHIESGLVHEVSFGRERLAQNQSINFYPIYWNSPNKHVAGIYYHKTNGELVRIPMYADKADTYKDDADKEDLCFYTNRFFKAVDYPAETDAEDCWHFSHTYNYAKLTSNWSVSYYSGFQFYSRPYTITPQEEAIAAGIYVEVNGIFYYTEAALNPDGKAHFAETVMTKGDGSDEVYTYLCFDEDGDNDYNDLVFYTPRAIIPVTNNELQWTVACEDLGGTYDYDFNDLVFRVLHTSGNDYATIIPLAAGGTLPATLYYNNVEISKEWHQHFGTGYDSSVMINTGHESTNTVWPIRVEGLPTDWSMSAFTSKSNGLNIRVTRADGTIQSVTAPSNGEAPQMLILPYEWSWPTEMTRIDTAYPGFGEWGQNYTNNTWVNNKVSDKVLFLGEKEVTSTKSPYTKNVGQ